MRPATRSARRGAEARGQRQCVARDGAGAVSQAGARPLVDSATARRPLRAPPPDPRGRCRCRSCAGSRLSRGPCAGDSTTRPSRAGRFRTGVHVARAFRGRHSCPHELLPSDPLPAASRCCRWRSAPLAGPARASAGSSSLPRLRLVRRASTARSARRRQLSARRRACSTGAARGAASAQGVGVREEAPDEAVGVLGALDLRDVAAALEHDLLGGGQPLLDVAAEAGRDELVVRAPDEQRRGLQLGQARVEAVRPKGASR